MNANTFNFILPWAVLLHSFQYTNTKILQLCQLLTPPLIEKRLESSETKWLEDIME